MTPLEAALILHPDTTLVALDYYAGLGGEEARVKICDEACRVAAEYIQKEEKTMITSKTKSINIADVKVPERFKKKLPSTQKIADRIDFYRKHKCFDKQLVVDTDNNLVDGYTVYLVCKMLGIEAIRGLVLKEAEADADAAHLKYEAHLYLEDTIREIVMTGQATIPENGLRYLACASNELKVKCNV